MSPLPALPRVWLENIRVGVDALRGSPLRTGLSVLGVLIGSAALIATMAVSDGMMSYAREQVLRNTSALTVTISPRTRVLEYGEWVPAHDVPIFTPADTEALRAQVQGVEAAALTLAGRVRVSRRGVRRGATLVLGSAGITEFQTLDLAAGRFFSDGEVAHNAAVVVVNYALARELTPGRDPVSLAGGEIYVSRRWRRVIGVQAATGFEDGRDPDCVLYAPIRAAAALLPPPSQGRFAPSIQLRAASVEAVDAVREGAAEWLSRRQPDWEQHARVAVAREQLQQVERGFLLMKLFIGALVGISMLVGGIGIMNVQLAAVVERTREIGIRKSVGARARDIQTQFVAESVAIALAGAAAGLVLGCVIALAVTAGFRQLLGVPIQAVLSAGSVVLATASASVVGLVFGTYPARRAARLSPMAALAHE